tara:strand:- start:40 stop:156 length:117 start_codon:yes stop_codon:yes gene_type:complete
MGSLPAVKHHENIARDHASHFFGLQACNDCVANDFGDA